MRWFCFFLGFAIVCICGCGEEEDLVSIDGSKIGETFTVDLSTASRVTAILHQSDLVILSKADNPGLFEASIKLLYRGIDSQTGEAVFLLKTSTEKFEIRLDNNQKMKMDLLYEPVWLKVISVPCFPAEYDCWEDEAIILVLWVE